MSQLKCYSGSSYAFCPTCKQTVVPTTLEAEQGFTVVCPLCAERVSESVDADLPDECSFKDCHRVPTVFCSQCGDAACGFHLNKGDLCDDCHQPGGYGAWNGNYGV